MNNPAKFCQFCHDNNLMDTHGYYWFDMVFTDKADKTICPRCKHPVTPINLTNNELKQIQHISKEESFIQEMISLKENNPEEFNARMQKFETYEHLYKISQDESFINAMIELKEKDPIEYQLKMQQFQASQPVQQPQPQQTNNLPKCPRCGSTAITAGQRGYSIVWGLLGSSKTVNRCSNCGHKWSPGR